MKENYDAVVLIDLQKAILQGVGGARQAEADAALEAILKQVKKLLKAARDKDIPVIHIQHDGAPDHRLATGTDGAEFLDAVRPRDGEVVVHKESSDSFFQTELEEELKLIGAGHIVIAGCMSQYCVDTTCRSAVTHGFDVTLCADGHTTVDKGNLTFEQIIAHHNVTLNGFGADGCSIAVKTIAEVIG